MTVINKLNWLKSLKSGDTVFWKIEGEWEKRTIKAILLEAQSQSGVLVLSEEEPLRWCDSSFINPFLP